MSKSHQRPRSCQRVVLALVVAGILMIQGSRAPAQKAAPLVLGGVVHSFETVNLLPMVSGFLKNQKVDIGSAVKKGDVIAEIDAPSLLREREQSLAHVEQAQAAVREAEAMLSFHRAEVEAARATIIQHQTEVRRSGVVRKLRAKELLRMKELVKNKAVDSSLVDAKELETDIAQLDAESAEAALAAAKANLLGKEALVVKAQAAILGQQASLHAARAVLEKASLFLELAHIRAPIDGVVTVRNHANGDFVRAGGHDNQLPILVLQRLDLMRVVVKVPEADLARISVGNTAEVRTRQGVKLAGKISRMARVLVRSTMPVEIDVPNPSQQLLPGMSVEVTLSPRASE